jgi:TolB-like protein/Flp pilus assembly protein TadD
MSADQTSQDHPARLGPYEISALIGAGGMGEVYRARDPRLQRELAIKVLPRRLAGDPELLRRFRQEAQALAAIQHPNIVTVYSVEEADGVPFITMELVRGQPLTALTPRGGLALQKLLDLAVQVADALAAAHRRGITHRDLKPANIMADDEGRVKILDFGLAKLRSEPAGAEGGLPTQTAALDLPLTREQQVMGTLPYMSPEQLEGKPADPRSDIFSLGVILYEMSTGQRPFAGQSSAALASSILRDTPPPLAERRPDFPGDLGRIVARCIQKDAVRRFQTATDLRNELEELRSGAVSTGITTKPSRTRASRVLYRWKWPAAAALFIILAGLAALIFLRMAPPAATSSPKIVVFPFENLGRAEDAYFASGMAEEITARLAAMPGLSVVSRLSARAYDRAGKTLKTIGHDLGVTYVLDGSVRWEETNQGRGRVRISPELIRVADDTPAWTQPFDRDLDDIFTVQSEIAERVAEHMGVVLNSEGRSSLGVRPTDNLEAYQAYLRGRYYTGQPHFSEENYHRAEASLKRAVALDPRFVLAYAELTKVHAKMYYFRVDLSETRRALARQALEETRRLAPGQPPAHLAAGFYHFWVERDAVAAVREFDAAARTRPDDDEVLEARAEALRMAGHWTEALEAYRKALEVNPGNADIAEEVSLTAWLLHRHAEALEYANQAIAFAPGEAWPYLSKVFNYWSWKGPVPEARTALSFVSSDHEWWLWSQFWEKMLEGQPGEALRRLEAAPDSWIRQKMWAAPKSLLAGFADLALDDRQAARVAFNSARVDLEAELVSHPDDPRLHSSLGIAYAALGRKTEAVRDGLRAVSLLPVEKDALYGQSHLHDLAVIYTLLGDEDKALPLIERLLSMPSFITPVWLRNNPQWARWWDNPRFKALLEKHTPRESS